MATRINSRKDDINKIPETFDELEGRRAEELDNAARLQEANDKILAEEHDRLAKKYGSDHPRVQKLESRLLYSRIMTEALQGEAARAKVRTEPFSSGWWRVNGRVFDDNGRPLEKLTVSLIDANGGNAEPLGYGCTDERGYYTITAKEEAVRKYEKQPVYLTVTDPNKKRLHTEKDPVVVTAGKIDYRDIFIGTEKGRSCEPPFGDEVKREAK